ncbi:opacity family porin [Neisseria mucosa]|uniref:opacity family porin n=1 Tax=Neisseria mucosa TaxID=488 RepID=UPI00051D6EB5|nr:opacity family porin [Neisseria mucosa]KGJ32874.1 membrane protein [Neisseria mucosa]
MKKVLVTLIALSLPTFALADATKGFYVQADAGYASVNLKDNSGSATFDEKVKGFSPRLSVGYDFGDFRLGADYTHYKSLEENFSKGSFHSKNKAKFQSVGVSAIYDFNTNTPVKPYVGARLGINRVSADFTDTAPGYYYEENYRKTKTGIGAMAGVSYEITPNVDLDAGYRYNYWGKFEETKLQSHELSAGVRVKF